MENVKEWIKKHTKLALLFVLILGGLVVNNYNSHKSADIPKIAIIYVDGEIVSGQSGSSLMGGHVVGADSLMSQLRKATKDDSVKALLLRVDSPGGSAAASQEIAEEMKHFKDSGKLIYVSMADTAASGGYWLAAYGDKIYANPGTITGSIGVYMGYRNLEALYEKIGVKDEVIKSGSHKDMMSPSRPMTDEERQLVQTMVDDMYNQFVEVVAQGRKMSPEQVKLLADGRVYTGRQAKEAGLVDELGNHYDALNALAKEVGIDENDIHTVVFEEEGSVFDKLFGTLKTETVAAVGKVFLGAGGHSGPRVQLAE